MTYRPSLRSAARIRPRRLGAALALAWFVGSAAAADLLAIVQLARDNDAAYLAARAGAQAGREKTVQGRAGLLPSVTFNASGRAVSESNTSINDHVNYHSGTATLSVVQPLWRQANREAFRQGEIQTRQAELQLRAAEQDLLLRTARGYFDTLQAQDALGTVRAQKQAFADQLAQATKSYQVGLSPVTDVNEAQARYDLTLAQEIAAASELELKQRALEKSIRTPLPPLARLDDAASVDLIGAADLESLADRAATDGLPVALAQAAEDLARAEVARQAAGQLPTLDLVANKSENWHASYGVTGPLTTRQTTLGLELSVPLYQGGAISSREREAAANLQRSSAELDGARLQAAFDARQALLGVRNGSALANALRQALSSNETQVRSTRRGLEVGVRNRVDVLNAEQQLYTTRRDLSAARYQTLLSGLQLKAAAGTLREADLQALSVMLKD